MRGLLFLVLGIAVAACSTTGPAAADSPESAPESVELHDLGPAPEFMNETWLNSQVPLRLSALRGRVVLLEMWTFGCVNCQHVIPKLIGWQQTYAGQGLVVIGNHYPEFGYERSMENLQAALERWEITYPVAQDNEGDTWRAYGTHYWPTLYLIDKAGRIRYEHIGEGAYEETEAAIRQLLAEPGGSETGRYSPNSDSPGSGPTAVPLSEA